MEDTGSHESYLTPAEMAERSDTSIDTLRYYEREGLLTGIERTVGGQRRYSDDDVAWVGILRCLRVTALPIREMKRFAELVRRGDDAIAERVELLSTHRVEVVNQMEALTEALQMIDHKVSVYSERLAATPTAIVESDASAPTLAGQGVRSGR